MSVFDEIDGQADILELLAPEPREPKPRPEPVEGSLLLEQWPPPADTCWRDVEGWAWWHDGDTWCLSNHSGPMHISHADPTIHPDKFFPMTRVESRGMFL